ncbi:MAG: hybrid sensor histidine kinase/response regulator, partial [Blastocatellia bacterium]
MAVAICLSANLLTWSLSGLRRIDRLTSATIIAALLAFSVVYFFLNTMMVAAHYALKHREGLIAHWRQRYSWTGLSYLAGAATAGFVYLALLEHGVAALLGIVPLVAVIYAMSRFYFMQAEERIKASERISLIVNNTSDAVFAFDPERRISYVNPAIKQLTDYAADETLNLDFLSLIHQDDKARFETVWEKLMRGEPSSEEEFRIQTKAGRIKWCSGSWGPLCDESGRQIGVQGHLRDISEHKALQSQLVHSQKMEAIGRLAGGIAHDFNNLLTAMIGYSQLALAGIDEADPVRDHVEQFLKASNRATALTSQLLAFARRQTLQPMVLDLNSLVREVDQLLRRLLGPDIELATVFSPSRVRVKADPGQIEQVIVNLAVNARDAMPDGGKLTIQTVSLHLPSPESEHKVELPSGDYVMLSVSDSGCGVDAETAARIFEPFFTTKGIGKGTGLGLSTVYGIVKQSSGHITVESEVGQGTTFRVYLPGAASKAPEPPAETDRSALSPGTETILVVDDDEGPRKMVAAVLGGAGYNILQASSADAALRQCQEYKRPIHLMVTDLVMPQVNGLELAE